MSRRSRWSSLGLAFYTGAQFPQEYRGDLSVAFHGSWNRSVPTGYKIVRIPLDEDGQPPALLRLDCQIQPSSPDLAIRQERKLFFYGSLRDTQACPDDVSQANSWPILPYLEAFG